MTMIALLHQLAEIERAHGVAPVFHTYLATEEPPYPRAHNAITEISPLRERRYDIHIFLVVGVVDAERGKAEPGYLGGECLRMIGEMDVLLPPLLSTLGQDGAFGPAFTSNRVSRAVFGYYDGEKEREHIRPFGVTIELSVTARRDQPEGKEGS